MNADHAFNKGPVKAEPKLYDLNVSLEELYNGALKKVKVNRKVRMIHLLYRSWTKTHKLLQTLINC